MSIDAKRRRLVTAGAMLAAVPAGVAGQPTGVPVRGPMTLAVTHGPHALPVLIAERLGLFAAEGLPLRVVHFPVGRIGLERLLAGEVQFATVADAPIMFASLQRTDFSILATITRSTGDNSMIVRNDRGINRAADLRGKRIGTARGSGGHFFIDTFLLYNGLTTADIVFVALEPQQVAPALASGEIDAAGLFGILATDALARLGDNGRILSGPGFFAVNFNLVCAPASAGVTDADAVRLLRAVDRAMDIIRRTPAEARRLAASILKVDAKEVDRTWDAFEYRLQLSQPLITQLEAQVRWAVREKLVPPPRRVPEFLDMVRVEPLRQVDSRAVRLVR